MLNNNKNKEYFIPTYNETVIKNNKIFLKEDFISYINQVKDPFIKELLLLIKRYHQGFEFIKLNDQTLFSSLIQNENDEKGILFNENLKESLVFLQSLFINKENIFHIKISIPPSFIKSECEALLVNDLININLKFVIYYEGSYEESFICEDKSFIETKIEFFKFPKKDLRFSSVLYEKQGNYNLNDDENFNENLLISSLVSVMNKFLYNSKGNYLNGIRQFLNHLQNFMFVYINDSLNKNQSSSRILPSDYIENRKKVSFLYKIYLIQRIFNHQYGR